MRWVVLWGAMALAIGCSEGSPASPHNHGIGFAMGPSAQSSGQTLPTRRLRRLSRREYDNVVRDLLGDGSRPADAFVPDAYTNGYDNGSVGLAVQSDQVAAYEHAAETLAANAVGNALSSLIGDCDPVAQGGAACLEELLSTFARRAYRRPPTMGESQRLRDLFASEMQSGTFNRAIQSVVEAILQSPQFLYREELGPMGQQGASGDPVRLTDDELATELSFLLTGSIPDPDLRASVDGGHFRTADDYAREATRLLATDGARQALRGFLHQWLATSRLSGVTKAPAFYPSFDASTASSMASELDQLFDQVLWSGTGSLRELFTTNLAFVDPSLAQIYGVDSTGSGFVPQALDARIRPGVLTRAGFLAVHSSTDSSGPIERGVFVLQSLMCAPPVGPPAGVPPAPAASDPSAQNMTTRQRFEEHVSSPVCASCHARIDGIGFGFEEFDGVGAYRDSENGQPIDSSGTVLGTGDPQLDGDFHGAAELTTKLAASSLLAKCYARQVYRYALGEVEPPGVDLGALEGTSSPDAQMTDVLLAFVRSPAFTTRIFQ